MEFFNSLNLTQIKGGTKLKQGDLGSVLSYSLTDENGQEITSFDTKTAYINLVLDDKIWFTTTTLVDISRVTFRIDKAIPIGLYYLEIKIDDYIFPSDRDSIILIEEGSTPYDLKELVPNYDVNMTIKGILSDLSQKGIDINDLKTKMSAIYNNALADHAEITAARGTHPNLRSRLDEVDNKQQQTTAQLAEKANKDEVTNVMTPKGNIAYASLPMTGNSVGWYYYCPDGDGTHGAGNYVWNGKSWFFGGTGDEGYNLLKKDIDTFHTIEKIPVVAALENQYLTSSNKATHNGFAISNVIVLKKDDVIKVTTNVISNMVAIKSTINSKECSTKYSLDVVNELTAGVKERTYKAKEDIEYIRYTYDMASGANVRVYRVNDNKNYDAVLNESISGYFNKGLHFAEGGGCYVTKNIHLKKGEILNYGCSAGTYNVVAVLVKMENDNAISVIQTANDNDYHEYKYEAQEDCEVSFTFSAIHRAFAFIQRSDDALKEIKENLTGINEDLTGINENLTGINEDLTGIKSESWIAKNNYVPMFKKIMCLGDSITYGYRTQQHSDTDRSYPSFLARLNSVETINGGISGATPKAWYNMRILNNSSMFNFADYDACIINLGQNEGLTDTLDEDVNQFSDSSQYADTQVAWYCKIVEHIISKNPRIKMFLLRGQKDKITNTVIQKIAQKYNIPSFDYTEIDSNLLDSSRFIGEDGTNYGVHYNTLGYYELARAVTKGINSDIAKNTNNYRGL